MAQKQVDDAVVRYQKILESPAFADLAWAQDLESAMRQRGMVAGTRIASPFLRPHFVLQKHFDQSAKLSAALFSAIERLEKLALETPAILQRLDLLPAERMLASINPGYSFPHVGCSFQFPQATQANFTNGFQPVSTAGIAYSEHLADLFFDCPPLKEFRKKHKLAKSSGLKALLSATTKAWKAYGGKKQPNLAILEFRQPFQSLDAAEAGVLAELYRSSGWKAELVSPEQLDYRQGVLRKGDFAIDMVLRASSLHDFLLRFDLNHPLVRAYRDQKVCIVNSFRAELAQKKTVWALLTDDTITTKFPAAEKKAIAACVPWTRTLAPGRTDFEGQTVDLLEYVAQHRERFVLAPNDTTANLPNYDGRELEQAPWDRAMKQGLRERYVVQLRQDFIPAKFPVSFYGALEYRDLLVEERLHLFLGEPQMISTYLSSGQGGFSTMEGFTPTFVLASK
ncbi:MAG: hypothetical protein NW208_13260 [Bryobacter sp.]|nr:hypothetical protein [Bryobacter sp.]